MRSKMRTECCSYSLHQVMFGVGVLDAIGIVIFLCITQVSCCSLILTRNALVYIHSWAAAAASPPLTNLYRSVRLRLNTPRASFHHLPNIDTMLLPAVVVVGSPSISGWWHCLDCSRSTTTKRSPSPTTLYVFAQQHLPSSAPLRPPFPSQAPILLSPSRR